MGAQLNTEWISVKDRMPDLRVGVLVTNGEEITAARLTTFGGSTVYWDPHMVDGYEAGLDIDGQITHWMPFPPPPKKES